VYACICHAVSETEVARHIADGANTEEAVGDRCGAGTGCGTCVERICEMIRAVRPGHSRLLCSAG
jgi:bacterioferritin-associated ferredoxin